MVGTYDKLHDAAKTTASSGMSTAAELESPAVATDAENKYNQFRLSGDWKKSIVSAPNRGNPTASRTAFAWKIRLKAKFPKLRCCSPMRISDRQIMLR